jgi:16S rRNA (guanine527-N7)-methyltransferase
VSTPSPAPNPASPPEPLAPTPEFLAGAEALGIGFEAGDLERLGAYLARLLAANATHNLTAITDPAEAWRKHMLDALTLIAPLSSVAEARAGGTEGTPAALRVIDVGTGGGVPGVPLACVLPGMRFTLLEATGKKVEFLRQVVSELGLENASVLQGRSEVIAHERAHREAYDVVIARAVGPLPTLAELTLPLCKPGGWVMCIKGGKAEQELAEAEHAIGLLGGRFEQIVDTPTGRIVLLEKSTRTPRLYPRADGLPKAKPLGLPKR